MASEKFKFHYVKTSVGTISGASVLKQTEDAINRIAEHTVQATADASEAQRKAEEALSTANTATSNASAAVSTANSASAKVNSLEATVNAWDAAVQEAVSDASQAVSTSEQALSAANSAVSTATEANNTANTALTNSQSAVSTANNANQLAQSAKASAESAVETAQQAVRDTAKDVAAIESLTQTATDQAAASASSASQAASSAQSSSDSANLSQAWAVKMDGMVTEDGTEEGASVDYSSKYYAQQAAGSASDSASSASASAGSASNAAASASAASGSKTAAANSASESAASASAAKISETNAAASASAAAASAEEARNYANQNRYGVSYEAQTLTEPQQTQARTNIGALGKNEKAASSGKADTATKWATKRTVSATGDATWSVSLDGSANASAALTLATVTDTAGTFGPTAAATLNYGGTFYVPQFTVDAKGRVTLSKHWAIKLPAAPAFATQAEAEAGTVNNKYMSPLRTKQAIDKLSSTVPPGTMIHFAGKTLPDGWLICNGAAVSRTTYAALFAAIGTTYGTGDGSTTFNLPNANGRFLECTTSTSQVGTKLEAGLPNISGKLTSSANWFMHADGLTASGALTVTLGSASNTSHNGGGGSFLKSFDLSGTKSSSRYGASSTVQPASLRVLVLIKA